MSQLELEASVNEDEDGEDTDSLPGSLASLNFPPGYAKIV